MLLSWMMLRKQGALTNVETWLLFAHPYQNSWLRACIDVGRNGSQIPPWILKFDVFRLTF